MAAPITGISQSTLKANKAKWDAVLNKYKHLYSDSKKTKKCVAIAKSTD